MLGGQKWSVSRVAPEPLRITGPQKMEWKSPFVKINLYHLVFNHQLPTSNSKNFSRGRRNMYKVNLIVKL